MSLLEMLFTAFFVGSSPVSTATSCVSATVPEVYVVGSATYEEI